MTMFQFSLYWYCLERFFCLLAVLLPASQDVVDSKVAVQSLSIYA